ncbi:hypothetical protein D9M72_426270 [compost metagenome]
MVEPGAAIGSILRFESEEIMDRAFRPRRRRMVSRNRRIAAFEPFQTDDADRSHRLIQERHVNGARLAPKAKQRPASLRKPLGRGRPDRWLDNDTLARAMVPNQLAVTEEIG